MSAPVPEVPGYSCGRRAPGITRRCSNYVLPLMRSSTGEVAAQFADVYGATVSKDTISRITDKVIGEMTEWCNRPLDWVYPVVFIDATFAIAEGEPKRFAPALGTASRTDGHRGSRSRRPNINRNIAVVDYWCQAGMGGEKLHRSSQLGLGNFP